MKRKGRRKIERIDLILNENEDKGEMKKMLFDEEMKNFAIKCVQDLGVCMSFALLMIMRCRENHRYTHI
jgi:hypothetical protein